MGTPNTTDFYTRFFAELFDDREIQATPKAFMSFFGNPLGGGRTIYSPDESTVEIDVIRGNGERLAATVHRGQSSTDVSRGKNVTDQNYSNIQRVYPLIEEEANINSTQLLKRLAGDTPYQRRTQLDRNRMLAMDLHYDLIKKHIRTMEYWAAESILSGQQSAIIGTSNTSLIYDFLRKSTHAVTVSTAWDNAGDVLGDIDSAISLIIQDSYMRPADYFMGVDGAVIKAMITNTVFQTLADNRRFELIQVSRDLPVPAKFQRQIDAGWTPYGRLRTPKGRVVWIFTNDYIYTNSAGTATPYMTSGKAFILPVEARFDRYFGPRDRMPVTPSEAQWYQEMFGFDMMASMMPPNAGNGDIVPAAAFYHDAYMPDGKKTVNMRTQSAPIFATTQTDAVVVLGGLLT
jgi:hypothetical protein